MEKEKVEGGKRYFKWGHHETGCPEWSHWILTILLRQVLFFVPPFSDGETGLGRLTGLLKEVMELRYRLGCMDFRTCTLNTYALLTLQKASKIYFSFQKLQVCSYGCQVPLDLPRTCWTGDSENAFWWASAVEFPAKATKAPATLTPALWHQQPPPAQQNHVHTALGLQHSFLLFSPLFVISPELYLYPLGSLELSCGPAEASAGIWVIVFQPKDEKAFPVLSFTMAPSPITQSHSKSAPIMS